jgi:hypothetical protein
VICGKLLEDLTRAIHGAHPAGTFGVRKYILYFRELWIQFHHSRPANEKSAWSKSASDFGI